MPITTTAYLDGVLSNTESVDNIEWSDDSSDSSWDALSAQSAEWMDDDNVIDTVDTVVLTPQNNFWQMDDLFLEDLLKSHNSSGVVSSCIAEYEDASFSDGSDYSVDYVSNDYASCSESTVSVNVVSI